MSEVPLYLPESCGVALSGFGFQVEALGTSVSSLGVKD